MKRIAVLFAAVLLVLAIAAPAAAAKPWQSYTVFRAQCAQDVGPDFRSWETPNTWHMRDFLGFHRNYFLVNGAWVEYGTNETVVMANGHADGATASGTFEIRGSLVGDFDGSWRWGMTPDGKATGQGVNASVGAHLKVDLLGAEPAGLPDPPPAPCPGVVDPDVGWEIWWVN
jgi:hypothetical protein